MGPRFEYDAAIEKSAARIVGHGFPFSRSELDAILDLHIRRAVSLDGIGEFTSVSLLTLVGCDPVLIDRLQGLRELRNLNIRDSGLCDIEGIEEIPLRGFYAPRNVLQDIEPLLRMPDLVTVDVRGNPLSEDSYRSIVPRLVQNGCRVDSSGELEWKLTVRLHASGVPISCYRDESGYRLNRPGMALTKYPDYAHPKISENEAVRLLNSEPERAYEYFRSGSQ